MAYNTRPKKQDFDSHTHCGAQVGTLSLYRCHVVTCSSDFLLYVATKPQLKQEVLVVRVGYRCEMCMRCASGSGWPHASPTAWGHGVVTLIRSTRSSTHTHMHHQEHRGDSSKAPKLWSFTRWQTIIQNIYKWKNQCLFLEKVCSKPAPIDSVPCFFPQKMSSCTKKSRCYYNNHGSPCLTLRFTGDHHINKEFVYQGRYITVIASGKDHHLP